MLLSLLAFHSTKLSMESGDFGPWTFISWRSTNQTSWFYWEFCAVTAHMHFICNCTCTFPSKSICIYLTISYEVELLWCVLESWQWRLSSGVHERHEGLVAGVKTSIVCYVLSQGQVPIHLFHVHISEWNVKWLHHDLSPIIGGETLLREPSEVYMTHIQVKAL